MPLTDFAVNGIKENTTFREVLLNHCNDLIMQYHKTEPDQKRAKQYLDNVFKYILENDRNTVIEAIKGELSDQLENIETLADQVYNQ